MSDRVIGQRKQPLLRRYLLNLFVALVARMIFNLKGSWLNQSGYSAAYSCHRYSSIVFIHELSLIPNLR